MKNSKKVNEYFHLLIARDFTSAEQLLKHIEEKLKGDQWDTGYLNALHGILLSRRAKPSSGTLASQVLDDPKRISSAKKDFEKRSRTSWGSDFDRGYFSAWTDYLKTLTKSKRSE